MTEVVAPIHGRRLDARFTLLEKLGSGGQGEVWRAHDDTRGIDIALKVPASADAPNLVALAAFEREHALAARLDHSSVLKVYPPHRSGEVVVLPMELATGGDLRRLRGAGYLDIIPVLLDIAQALEHAHERGVIHRDLKPGNVLFDARGRVKLADFGAAGTTSTTAADARMQGLSPFTASPEQLRGEAPTESDDIYGLGALAYELLSGYPPYYPHFDLRRAQEEPVPDLVPTRQIPPLLSALVMRMLAKNRRERPRSMREVIDELDTALNDTLAFDFESIVDPTHGAPSVAVLVGPPPSRPVPAAARAGQTPATPAPTPTPAPKAEPANVGQDDDDAEVEDLEVEDLEVEDLEDQEEEEAPDLGLIPDLLVAHALVVTPSSKGTRSARIAAPAPAAPPTLKPAPEPPAQPTTAHAQSASEQAARPAATPSSATEAAASQAGKLNGQTVHNETMQLPPEPTSATRGGAVASRASNAQTVGNETMQLPPEPASATRGVGAAWLASNAETVHNETMQLPPEPASATRGVGAAWLASNAQTVHNETMQLPPEPASATGGVGAAWLTSNVETVHNETMQLPPEPASATRGVGGAWLASNAQTVHNETMQLPPEPASATGGAGGAWLTSNAQTEHNETMQLPPEPTSTTRGLGAAWRASNAVAAARGSHAQAANEQSVQLQPTPTPTSPGAAGGSPQRQALHAQSIKAQPSRAPAPQSQTPPQAASLPAAASNPRVAPNLGGAPNSAGAPNPGGAPNSAGAPDLGDATNSAGAPSLGRAPNLAGAPSLGRAPISAAAPNPTVLRQEAPASQLRHTSFASDGLATGVADVTGHGALGGGAVGGGAGGVVASGGSIGGGVAGGPRLSDDRPLWENLNLDSVPRVARLEPIRRRHWPVVLLGVLAGVAVAVFYWLPRYTTQSLPFDLSAISRATKSLTTSLPSTSPTDTTTTAETPAVADSHATANSAEAKFQAARQNFDQRLAVLETRGAGVWGGPEFGMAKMRAAESVGAHDAGSTQIAQERLADASHLLDEVESRAPQALAAQLAAGQKALAAGQEGLANQAFDLAKRIDPNDKRIAEGQRHTHNLTGVLPLLADGQNAENARNYSRAAQDYSQALSLDPGNDKARAGLARANAAFGEDRYAKAVGSGFAALGAGRLDDAQAAFEQGRAIRPNGPEAAEGLRRVRTALSAKGFASLRQRAAGLEAQERWDEAVQAYNSALQADPSLAFAQEGKDRAAARAELNASLQALIDRPERLASPSIRNQARALLDTASQQSPSGPVLRSQIARLGIALPDYDSTVQSGSARSDLLDKPVRLSLVSDNATAVAIPSIGQFGTFAKRDIQLKPGRYTVIGTRDGFRDVRRDVTIAPGQESQTVSVSCSDPI